MISIYYIILICLMIFGLIGFKKGAEKIAYRISFIILSAFLVFRYGQGTDWLSYNYIFEGAPQDIDFNDPYYKDYHSEIGWKLINNAVKACGLDFVFISIATSLIEMFMLSQFINKYSNNRAFSLLIAYPVVYLTYFFSAMRQGLVLAFFLGVMVEWLKEGKNIRYLACVLVASTIHSLSIILLVPLIVSKIQIRTMSVVLLISILLGVAMIPALPRIVQAFGLSYTNTSISIMAIMYRAFIAVIVLLLYSGLKKKNLVNPSIELLVKIYVTGLAVYCICLGNEVMASRLSSPMLAVEIALIPLLLANTDKRQFLIIVFVIIAVTNVMTMKNISSYVEQGSYSEQVNQWNYPYISLFNDEDIYKYSMNKLLVYLQPR